MSTTTIEKLASIPPATILVTSLAGVNWSAIFYAVSTLWVLLQIYFRIRKEYGKWKARREVQQRDLLALHVRDMTADSE